MLRFLHCGRIDFKTDPSDNDENEPTVNQQILTGTTQTRNHSTAMIHALIVHLSALSSHSLTIKIIFPNSFAGSLLPVLVSNDDDWHVRVMYDVIADGAHDGSPEFAEPARARDDVGDSLLQGTFANG